MPVRAGGLGQTWWCLCAQSLSVLGGPTAPADLQLLSVLGRLWHAAFPACTSLPLMPAGVPSRAPLG